MAADAVYVDPSGLLKLYLHQPGSAAMSAWRTRVRGALTLTLQGRVEIANGICLAAFRRGITAETMTRLLASFDEDVAAGHFLLADLLWRAVLRRADQLSRTHTSTFGCRALDLIHVASALELGLRTLVTFDVRQQRLARAAGLKVIEPSR